MEDLLGREIETEVSVLRIVGAWEPNPQYVACDIFNKDGVLIGQTVRSAALLRKHFALGGTDGSRTEDRQ